MKLSSPQLGPRKRGMGKRRKLLKRGRKSMNGTYIPVDLQINILERLPVRSLLRFRCVSKLWSSVIDSRDFRNRYANSSRSSGLLVSVGDRDADDLTVVSSPSPKPEGDTSVPLRDLSLLRIEAQVVCGAVRGLICFKGAFQKVGICNPSTRQIHILPKLKFNRVPDWCVTSYFLGHDPIEDQYKLLAIDSLARRLEHQILVLRRKEAWREISCGLCPHTAATKGLCMNGFIYYGAIRTPDNDNPDNPSLLVSFDVRLEKFNFINVPDLWFASYPTLINYRGKVGVVEHPQSSASFRLWILEDAQKEEWSMLRFLLPKSALGLDLHVMAIVSSGELCLASSALSVPFYLHYYNLERNRIRKVRIKGLPVRKLKLAKCFSLSVSDHSESFSFIET